MQMLSHRDPHFEQNVVGWTVTTFAVSVAYRFVEQTERVPMLPFGRGHKTVILLPLLGCGALMRLYAR